MTVKYILTHTLAELPAMCTAQPELAQCQGFDFMLLLKEVVHFFIIAITVVVVAMPEGLPLAVTISLAYSVMKMKQENNLVRKLDASETMGGADQICTDKTGTLTQNQMTVRGLWTCGEIYQNQNLDNLKFFDLPNKELLGQGVLYNCSARVEKNDIGELEAKGNCTEQGLIKYLLKNKYPALERLETKNETLADGTGRIVATIPFNSKRKKATTAVLLPESNDTIVRVFVKGAPDFVLDLCDTYIGAGGDQMPLNDKQYVMDYVVRDNFAKNAFRTLLIAYKDISLAHFEQLKAENNGFAEEKDREQLEKLGLTVIGIYGLQDPLRPEIVQSVKDCHKAGITIRMVTGDNLDTAKAIAIEAGILTEHEAQSGEFPYAFMIGQDFRKMCGQLKKETNDRGELVKEEIENVAQFTEIAKQLKVLARSTPEDKYMLVTGLKQLGMVVAVTGDGTNDAPALKKADVGFAMGIAGTEVAKDASDIILLNDNFASCVTAVKWGRNIYTNVRKFLQFQLTVNVVAMFIVFIGSVLLRDPPLTSVQMLWVNLIMDTCGALALATEPPSDDLLNQKPYPRTESIVTAVMIRNIIGQAIYQMAVLLVLLFQGQELFNIEYDESKIDGFIIKDNATAEEIVGITNKLTHYTLIFHAFVFMQIFNEINARKLGEHEYNVFAGFFNNILFLGIVIATCAIQYLMVEYGGASVRTIPLTTEQHLICLGIGMYSLVHGLFVKWLLPVRWFMWVKINEEPMTAEQSQKSAIAMVRKPTFRKSQTKSMTKVNDSHNAGYTAIN